MNLFVLYVCLAKLVVVGRGFWGVVMAGDTVSLVGASPFVKLTP